MSLKEYLYWKRWKLALSIVGVFVLNLFLTAAKVSANNTVGISVTILFCFLILHIYEYLKANSYFKELTKNVNSLDEGYISDFIPTAYNLETYLFEQVLRQNIDTYNNDISKLRIKERSYKEYIEQWVHEIKLPIATINLITDNAQGEIDESILEEIDNIEYYVEQVLFYAKSEYVEKDYIIKRINIADEVKAALKKHKRLFISSNVNLSINLQEAYVLSDSKWLAFILAQLLTNAVKYSEHQNKKIALKVSKQDNPLVLSITNNGDTIPLEDIKYVFNKGFIGKNGRKNQRSTGMGLYLVKNLCQKLGHDITVNSKNGITEFKIVFSEFKQF